MGKKLRDEDLVLNIIVNGDPAKKKLGDLENTYRELKNSQKELLAEKRKLERAGKQETARYKAINTELKENRSATKMVTAEMDKLRQKIGLAGLTMKQLRAESKKLRTLRDTVTPGTAAWKQYDAQLQKVNAHMAKVNAQAKGVKGGLGNLADGLNRFAMLGATVIATITAIGMGIRKLTNAYIELTDQLADVRKTTGLTDDGVKELYSDIQKIDSRTSAEGLLGISRIAGKLGVEGKENILGFTRAADQLVVALGEDLGGDTEETIRQVGKLVDIFGVQDDFGLEEGMLKVGSAINSLGAASTANEGYLVEFTKRMGGVAKQAGVSIENVLGLGATLDQLGQSSELSATAMNKVLVGMFVDTAEYAQIAGMSVEDFTDLLNTDSNEALIAFFNGLQGNNEGLTQLAEKLDIVGQDGARTTQVLATLANNTDILRDQQKLANEEFEKGTSLSEEFGIKNETMAAKLDKARKAAGYVRAELGEKLAPIMAGFYGWTTKMMKGITALIDGFIEYKHIIVPVTAAILAYIVAIKAKAIAYKIVTIAKKVATAATWLFNAALTANPIGIFVALLVAAGTALYMFAKKTNQVTAAQDQLNKVNKRAAEIIADERSELDRMLEVAKDEKASKEDRLKAIKRLNEISPEYLGNLTLENIKTDEGTKAVEAYVKALEKKAKIQAAQEQLTDIYKEMIDIQTDMSKTSTTYWQDIQTGTKGFVALFTDANAEAEIMNSHMEDMHDNAVTNLKDLNERKNALLNLLKSENSLFFEDPTVTPTPTTTPTTPTDDDGDIVKKEQDISQELFEEAQQRWAALDNLEAEYLLSRKDKSQTYGEWKKEYDKNLYNDEIALLNDVNQEHITSLYEQYNEKIITKDELDQALQENEIAHLLAMKDINEEYGQDINDIYQQILMKRADMIEEHQEKEKWYAKEMENTIKNLENIALNHIEQSAAQKNELKQQQKDLDNAYKKGQITFQQFTEQSEQLNEDQIKSSKDRKRALLNDIRSEIKALIAKAIAMIVAKEVGEKGLKGLITGAIAGIAAAALFEMVVPQFKKGKMSVVGQDDGKLYSNVPVYDKLQDGLVETPSLVGEQPEIIINPKTTARIKRFNPEIIDAIQYWHVPQFAAGKMPVNTSSNTSAGKQQIVLNITLPKYTQAVIDQNGIYDLRESITIQEVIEANATS